MSCFKADELFFSLDLYHPLWLIIPTTFLSLTWGFSQTKKTKLGSIDTELCFALKISFTTYAIPLWRLRGLFSQSKLLLALTDSGWGQQSLWLSESPEQKHSWGDKPVGAASATLLWPHTNFPWLMLAFAPRGLSLLICKIRTRTLR